jgi:hypothetical protein
MVLVVRQNWNSVSPSNTVAKLSVVVTDSNGDRHLYRKRQRTTLLLQPLRDNKIDIGRYG